MQIRSSFSLFFFNKIYYCYYFTTIWPSSHNKILEYSKDQRSVIGREKSLKVLENCQTKTSSSVFGQEDDLNEWQLGMNGTEVRNEWLRFVSFFILVVFFIKIALWINNSQRNFSAISPPIFISPFQNLNIKWLSHYIAMRYTDILTIKTVMKRCFLQKYFQSDFHFLINAHSLK